ncbi:hypothetical protein ACFR97_05715 [Haloplanus litoreus]|uniref:Uncharacterized protein n=1 Tax=Haloplanus litoreus TaxID=767515 RepID=A0ABD5ZW34_9EURY
MRLDAIGGRHRAAFGTCSGQPVAECLCKGYTPRLVCHLAAMLFAYTHGAAVVADLDSLSTRRTRCRWVSSGEA